MNFLDRDDEENNLTEYPVIDFFRQRLSGKYKFSTKAKKGKRQKENIFNSNYKIYGRIKKDVTEFLKPLPDGLHIFIKLENE